MKTPTLKSPINKVLDLQTCNFFNKRLQRRCFPVNIAKFLKTSILKNICKRLLLDLIPYALTGPAAPGGPGGPRPPAFLLSKKKKGKLRKKRTIFKAETIERLSPRSKCYSFSHSRVSFNTFQCSMAPPL